MKAARFPVVLAAALLLVSLARAGDGHDHDRARQAVESGEIQPLRTILERVERETPGQILEVELEHHEDRWIYEIKVLRTGGSLVKLRLDARDGTLLGHRRSPGHPGGKH